MFDAIDATAAALIAGVLVLVVLGMIALAPPPSDNPEAYGTPQTIWYSKVGNFYLIPHGIDSRAQQAFQDWINYREANEAKEAK